MTLRPLTSRFRRFRRDEDGATLVEFGLVAAFFLFLAFGLIDFGRLGFSYVMAQKATERAVRLAVVQAPICLGVPVINQRNPLSSANTALTVGMSCSADPTLCQTETTVSCSADHTQTGLEIYNQIRTLLPTNATAANLRFSYAFDPDLGFLGGPYTPVVTAELEELNFEFVTPIGALATVIGANSSTTIGEEFAFPSMSNSLPAEALFDGESS
ncbi:TadE/TadG family type IV pilus assembly protein [Pseudooctadecabacter sp.]|uniref:TadE/TadG family type IV pilus assembly protein n=1 Tax=Pseudooctadecabacter sp. TaxID=1966338 RepID=UPI0035C86459